MTGIEKYAELINNIFGIGSATFDVSYNKYNHVIGALGSPDQFTAFKSNFEERLRRLAILIQIDVSLKKDILSTINRIATSEWDGAYAELCALDYFLSHSLKSPGYVLLDNTTCAEDTIASDMGMKNANHDMYFTTFNVCMDTKLLSDKIGDILKGICKNFKSIKNFPNLTILPSYSLDDDFSIYQNNRKQLLEEMIENFDNQSYNLTEFSSRVIHGLSYKFQWQSGFSFTESEYSPIQHARNNHHLLFAHAKKFSKIEPTVIVFVIFPWSGEHVFPFEDSKRAFFKEFGDNFFSGYISSSEQAKNFNNKIKTSISVSDLTKHLSGIMFLEDNCILAENANDINVNASFYWNPNAYKPLLGSLLDKHLQNKGALNLLST